MRRVEGGSGTLSDTAVCKFPLGLDATRLEPRYAGAGVILPCVDLNILGGDAARKPACG